MKGALGRTGALKACCARPSPCAPESCAAFLPKAIARRSVCGAEDSRSDPGSRESRRPQRSGPPFRKPMGHARRYSFRGCRSSQCKHHHAHWNDHVSFEAPPVVRAKREPSREQRRPKDRDQNQAYVIANPRETLVSTGKKPAEQTADHYQQRQAHGEGQGDPGRGQTRGVGPIEKDESAPEYEPEHYPQDQDGDDAPHVHRGSIGPFVGPTSSLGYQPLRFPMASPGTPQGSDPSSRPRRAPERVASAVDRPGIYIHISTLSIALGQGPESS